MTVNTIGYVTTELNAKKGIWCEFCGRDCSEQHLITITSTGNNTPMKELTCTTCAVNLIKCLRQTLVVAVLTEKGEESR